MEARYLLRIKELVIMSGPLIRQRVVLDNVMFGRLTFSRVACLKSVIINVITDPPDSRAVWTCVIQKNMFILECRGFIY